MKRALVVVGALLLGSSAVMADQKLAVEQDNFMRSIGKAVYVTMLKMGKGDLPYDQKQVDAALAQLETDVPKIPTVFKDNPKEQVVNATYGAIIRSTISTCRPLPSGSGLRSANTSAAIACETPPGINHDRGVIRTGTPWPA